MKSKSFSSRHGSIAQQLLFLLLAASSVVAQNFVRNPDFEEPLGGDNWTVVYVSPSGPSDFLVAGRTTYASKDMSPGTWDGGVGASTNYWSKFGGHFAPNHVGLVHAYFRQVVTGLQANASYVCSAWMVQFSKGNLPVNQNHFADVYLETIGGAVQLTQPFANNNATNNAFSHPEYWRRYSVTNTANGSGQIELRLHYNKTTTISYANNPWEYRNCNGFFDRVSVIPLGQASYLPPYSIVSASASNSDITLQWATVRNNRYRIQASTNLSDPSSWFPIERSPRLDTNFAATGTSFTFKTNVASLFYYDPLSLSTRPEWRVPNYFDPNGPLFFRITAESYAP